MQLCFVQTVVRTGLLADEDDVAIMPSDILTCCCRCCPLMMLLLLMLLLMPLLLLLLLMMLLMSNSLESILFMFCWLASTPSQAAMKD